MTSQTSFERRDLIGHTSRLNMQMKLYEREHVLYGLTAMACEKSNH